MRLLQPVPNLHCILQIYEEKQLLFQNCSSCREAEKYLLLGKKKRKLPRPKDIITTDTKLATD